MSINPHVAKPFNPGDPTTWGLPRPPMIAHDVGGFRDYSTAVVGGKCPFGLPLVGILECVELPQGLYGSPRAAALANVDARYGHNALIIADLSNDRSYAEPLLQNFGARVIGVQICVHGDGMDYEWRPVKNSYMAIYKVGRSYLLESLHAEFECNQVRLVDDPIMKRAYQQLADLELERRDTGIVYKCPSGKHDDLAISIAMLAWAARHPHLQSWFNHAAVIHRPHRAPRMVSSAGWT